jgi:hypothetical protein
MVVSVELGECSAAWPRCSGQVGRRYCDIYANSVYIVWTADQISIEIEDVDHPVAVLVITTPVGTLSLIGSVSIVGRVLRIDRAHVEGLTVGALGRTGLNAVGRKLLEVADVDEIIIQGGTRTTGRTKGKVPRPIRFPRAAGLEI